MSQRFVGRGEELAFLEEKYFSDQAELIVIHGRRRIGKTELIHQFSKAKPHVHFQCEKSGSNMIMEEFQDLFEKSLKTTVETVEKLTIKSWHEFFREIQGEFKKIDRPSEEDTFKLGNKARQRRKAIDPEGDIWENVDVLLSGNKEGDQTSWIDDFSKKTADKFIIAMDEFPNLMDSDEKILHTFREIWDEVLSKVKVMLILCGSSKTAMDRTILSPDSPIFDRLTGRIFLEPLKIHQIEAFFPEYPFNDIVRVYGVCDGIPGYLEQFDPHLSVFDNIEKNVLNKTAYLFSEGALLLKNEFREYKNYFLILTTIAKGKETFNEITRGTGLDKGVVSKYLSYLQTLRFVEAKRPVTSKTDRTRNAKYCISDNFLKFWLRFTHIHRHEIEEFGSLDFNTIQHDFDQYMDPIFADACRDYIKEKYKPEFPHVGAWWDKKGKAISIIAVNEDQSGAILGECSWSEHAVGVDLYEKLEETWAIMSKDRPVKNITYYLFSKSGFTSDLIDFANEKEYLFLIST